MKLFSQLQMLLVTLAFFAGGQQVAAQMPGNPESFPGLEASGESAPDLTPLQEKAHGKVEMDPEVRYSGAVAANKEERIRLSREKIALAREELEKLKIEGRITKKEYTLKKEIIARTERDITKMADLLSQE